MREFFRGWKRKLGVVTLICSAAGSVALVRSYLIHDEFYFPLPGDLRMVESFSGKVRYERVTPNPVSMHGFRPSWISKKITGSEQIDPFSWFDIEWRWRFCGFDFGEATSSPIPGRFEVREIPYWSIVIPLTLLSAYLLLSKRSPYKPSKPISGAK